MKPDALPKIILDADPILRRCGLPYWAWAVFREMRVGDSYQLVDFVGPGVGSAPSTAGVSLFREYGYFRLESGWLLNLGKNSMRRGHLWSWVEFKMLPGRKLELIKVGGAPDEDTRRRALYLVQLVLRRAKLLARWAERSGDRKAMVALSPSYFKSRHTTELDALTWLERMRGPELGKYPTLGQES